MQPGDKDPLGILTPPANKQSDPLGLLTQKKSPNGSASASTSPSLPSGLGNIPSIQTLTEPSTVPYTQDYIQKQQQQDETDRKAQSDKSNKQLQQTYKSLDPETKATWEKINNATKQPDELRQPTDEEIAHWKFMDTPVGKVVGATKFLTGKTLGGTVDVIKGATHEWNKAMGSPAADIGNDIVMGKASELANLGQTKNDIAQAEGNKALSTAGMMSEFAPTIAAGEISKAPQALMFLQGVGQGKDLADKLDIANPIAKEALIQGTGVVNLALSDIKLFGKLPTALKGNVATGIALDALKESAGKDLSSTEFKSLLQKGANTFAEKLQRAPLEALSHYNNTVRSLTKLNVGNFALHKAVDAIQGGSGVFNETPGDLAANEYKTITQDAPMFAAIPAARELTKLTPLSNYKNSVVEHLMDNPNDAEGVKTGLAEHAQEQGWTPEEVQATKDHVDKIASAVKSLPSDMPPPKKEKAIGLVLDRNDLQKDLDELQSKRASLDPSLQETASSHEQFLTDKIEQANDKIRQLVTGKRTTYSKDESDKRTKFYKTTDGTREEISPSRYDLENLERTSKQQNNENESSNGEVRGIESRQENGQNGSEKVSSEGQKENGQEEVKHEPHAIQEQSTGEVGVRNPSKVREGVGGQNEPKESAKEGEEGSETSIKNAKIDSDREKRGLSPLMSEASKDFGNVWDGAMKKLDDNPNAGKDLVDALHDKPRATTDTENALIAHTLVEAKNDYDKANESVVKAQDAGEDTTEHEAALERTGDRLHKIEEVARKTGTETARGLNSRKMMIRDDMSLTNLETRKRVVLGRKLTTEEREELRKVHENYAAKEKEYEATIERLTQRNRELQEKTTVKRLTKEAKTEKRNKTKSDIHTRIKNTSVLLSESLKQDRSKLNANNPFGLSAKSIKLISDQAKNYINLGITELDGLVDKLYDDLKDHLEDITKRDVRDLLSGYGQIKKLSQVEIDKKLRELKSEARSISALEDISEGNRPLKSGLQRDEISDKQRDLNKQVRDKLRESGVQVKSKEEYLKTALDAVKTRLKNQIKDIQKQIETGVKPTEKSKLEYDNEANALKKKRDELKQQLNSVSDNSISDEQKIKNAIKSSEKSLSEYERRVKEKDFSKRFFKKTPETPELKDIRGKRDAAKQEYEDLKNATNPKLTPEQIALKSIKTRTANQIKEYQRRLDEKDFSTPEKKPPTELDPEAIKAKADLNRVRDNYEAELEKDRLAKRGNWEKGWDKFLKYRRAELLLNLSGAAKVGMASAYRILSQPLHEIVGSVERQIPGIKQIAAKAPREGAGFVPEVEWKALKTVWNAETLSEVKKKFKGQLDNLDTAFGDKKEHFDTDRLLDLAGNIHSAEKEFAKQNEFRRSVLLRTKWAEANGVDMDNPFNQLQIGVSALKDANRQIFMADNIATTAYRSLLNYLESKSSETKFGSASKISAGVLKLMLPIVKVPTNYLIEKAQYTPVLGALKAVNIMRKGLSKMTPDQADYVMRIMKKQGIGAGLLAIGYANPTAFGGFHIPGKKRDENDPLNASDVKLFGVSIPHYLTHTPLLTLLQLGATIRRASWGETAMGTAVDFAESTPFYETPKDAVKAMESSGSMQQFIGNTLRGLIVPNIVSQAAQHFDTDAEGNQIKRSPKTIGQGIESGIPGLRQNVPIKSPHPQFDKIQVGEHAYHLSNTQLQEREKFYNDFMKTPAAKALKLEIAKTTNKVEKKKLSERLKTLASKVSKRRILTKYHNSETGGYNIEQVEE